MEDIEDAELGAGSGAMATLPRSTLVPVQPQVGLEPAAAPSPANTGNVCTSCSFHAAYVPPLRGDRLSALQAHNSHRGRVARDVCTLYPSVPGDPQRW